MLDGFDGSFFKGRYYARQPEAMIDVGNDREFGFLHHPSLAELEEAFSPLFEADLPAPSRRRALELASFFRLTSETEKPAIQMAILRGLSDPDPGVRAAARSIVSLELDISRIEDDPRRVALVRSALERSDEARQAVLAVIGRNKHLAARPEIQAAIRRLVVHNVGLPALLPVLKTPVVHDTEVVSLLLRDWPKLSPAQRLEAIEVLLGRPALVDVAEPRDPVMQVLRRGVTDPSAAVRDRTLRGVNALPALWTGKGSTALLLSALADDAASISPHGSDSRLVQGRVLESPRCARVPQTAADRPGCSGAARGPGDRRGARARPDRAGPGPTGQGARRRPGAQGARLTILAAQGVNPAEVEPDVRLGPPRLLSFSTFRRRVNPLFYQASDDGYACVNCHQNHTILRITDAGAARGPSGEQIMINYNSALKVVNLGDPESSLLLRKPRSPQGQGGPEPDSRTGLTHVGGPRWENAEHPAYQAVLGWIREASLAAASPAGAEKYSADSYAPDYAPAQAGDGDLATIWHTEFIGAMPGYPHELVVDLGTVRRVEGLLYVPRQDSPNGRVKEFEIRVSTDGKTWSKTLAAGSWPNEPAFQYVALPASDRALCPASRLERGRRPAHHERGRGRCRIDPAARSRCSRPLTGQTLQGKVILSRLYRLALSDPRKHDKDHGRASGHGDGR